MHTDYYGGTLSGEDEANYLFSDDASAKDTVRYVNLCVCCYGGCLQTLASIDVVRCLTSFHTIVYVTVCVHCQ